MVRRHEETVARKISYKQLQRLSDGPFAAQTVRYACRFLVDYPDHGPGWLLLGIALVELARYKEAERAIKKSIKLCPPNKRQIPLAQMGHLLKEAGKYDQAARWYRKAIVSDPDNAAYHIYLGAVLAKQGRLEEAEASHRTATRCPVGCIDEAYLNLGFVLRAQERFEEAAKSFREAIRLDPKYRAAKQALRDVERCLSSSRARRRRTSYVSPAVKSARPERRRNSPS
jgi:tetratricopeptide (TPR) repeat protein